ncbi:MAG TPA: hypothetical protein ENJ62_02020 [Bryobacterales bacterium]|nr:hypothetical protein [Bryobacterales bacterium]
MPATSPPFGYKRIYEDYDQVLAQYARWLNSGASGADQVIDLHGVLTNYLAKRRQRTPDFVLARDGIHPAAEGHRLMGETILRAWGIADPTEPPAQLWQWIVERTRRCHAALLPHVGHRHPAFQKGPPWPKVKKELETLDARIDGWLARHPQ